MTSVTVVVPMAIRRRGGRKQIIGPDGAPVRAGQDSSCVQTTGGDPTLVKALARAFRWRRLLEEGRYASIRELASMEGVDRTYVGRVLNLTLLAPEIVEAVLDGWAPAIARATTGFRALQVGWVEQQTAWLGGKRNGGP